MSEFYRQASHRESMDADEQKERPAQPQMSAREAIQKLREGLNGIECASYEQARKINTLMDEFAEAFARSRGERKNG